MQIIADPRARGRGFPYVRVGFGIVLGAVLLGVAITVAYVTLATPFLLTVSTSGPLTLSRALVGVLSWTFALTAPVGFGLLGVLRIALALDRIANRDRGTPAVRAARSLGDDMHVAANVLLPDGRPVPELVIGPFGAAVISEMPPPKTIRRYKATWEQRMADGEWRPVENPLEKTVRDAERVRRWFGADDRDFVVKVHAAVVDPGLTVERTPTCAVITPGQIAAWLASLPSQRGMSVDRRTRLVQKIRSTF
jgi:hypothetical protein